MGAKILGWLKELPFVHKIIAGIVVTAVLGLVVYFSWGFWALVIALGITAVVSLCLVVFNLFLKSRLKSRGATFSSGLVNDIKKAKAEIGSQFERALKELKTNGIDIYQLPWFFFVGEPQSGKSFTIRSSGLNFPVGSEGISGAGGTRNCDFWFTNEAVILDTAGRLLIQKDEVVDKEQWSQVLRFLTRYRANCPINGVILGIPCTSLLEEDSKTREEKAEVIRKRLKELQDALQIRFPVSLVIMKTDLVLGFESFFKRLPVLERKQLFGWSNDARFDQSFDPARFDQAFESICQDLQRWRLKFLNDESLPENVDQLYVFPEEFRALKVPLVDYLNKIFIKGPYGQPGFFRGFFFTSSLQEGRAIPQAISNLLGGIAENLKRSVASLHEVQARSSPFFIRDFYVRKLFSEKGLVLRTDRSRLVNAIARGVALWGGSTAVVLGLLLLGLGYFQLGRKLEQPRDLVGQIRNCTKDSEMEFLENAEKLALCIQDWKGEKRAWHGAILEPFFPAPARDQDLVKDLEEAFKIHLADRHLAPFLKSVQEILKTLPSDGALSWAEFQARSQNLLRMAAIGAGIQEKGGFSEIVKFYRAQKFDPAYLNKLVAQYDNFVGFGGDLPALQSAKGKTQFWEAVRESARPLEEYLGSVLKLEDSLGDKKMLADADEPLNWWRNLIVKADAVLKAYQDLLAIQPGSPDGKIRPFEEAVIANRASFVEKLKSPWEKQYKNFDEAWKAHSDHLGKPPKEPLSRHLSAQAQAIESFYKRILEILASLQERSDKSAEEPRKKINEQKESLLSQQKAFAEAIHQRFKNLAHLHEVRMEEGSEGTDKGPEKSGVAQLTSSAAAVHRKCKYLNDQITANLAELTDLEEAPFGAKTDHTHFPKALEDHYAGMVKGFKELGISRVEEGGSPRPAAEAGKDPWQAERFNALITVEFQGVVTDRLRHLLRKHLEQAGARAEAGLAPASDSWFKSKTDFGVSRADLLFELPDPGYGKGSYEAFRGHLGSLEKFLDKCVQENFSFLDKDNEDLRGKLESWFQEFEGRFLEAWRVKVESLRFRPRDEEADWKRFRNFLKEGLGLASDSKSFQDRLKRTILLAAEAASAVPEGKGRPAWAAALALYRDPKKADLENALLVELGKFFNYVEKDLKDEPIPSLELIRGEESKSGWTKGYPELLRRWREQFKAQSFNEEYFAKELLELSSHGKEALLKSAKKQFDAEWRKFAADNAATLDGKFPFLGDRRIFESTANDCPIFSGSRQLQPGELIEILGYRGKLTRLIDTYKKCLPIDKDEDPEGFVLRIHPKKLEFFRSCLKLREFIFNVQIPESEKFREVQVKLKVPGENNPKMQATQEADDLYKLKGFGYFRFAIDEGLPKGLPPVDHQTREKDYPLKWEFGDRNSKVAHYVLNKEKQPWFRELAKEVPRLKPENCDKPVVEKFMHFQFEARGPWALVLFLKAYGEPLDGNPKSWLVRYQYPEIVFPETEERSRPTRRPEIYFGLELDKPLGPLPHWEEAKGAGE
ncbi:MAG: hypothetical protein HY717_01500 [Planctomycetes bacterium]|nr:hypothetical protein [Planctomycetota bacterium]